MAIGHRADSSGDLNAPGGTTTITKPGSTASTDVLIAQFLSTRNSTTNPNVVTAPAGWTQIGSAVTGNDGTNELSLYVFWALGSVSGLGFTNSQTSGLKQAWVCSAFTGVDNTTPIDSTATGNTGSAGVTTNAVTIVNTGAWHLIAAGDLNNHDLTASGFTGASNGPSASNASCTLFYNTTPKTAGDTPTGHPSISVSDPGDVVAAQPFALAPASANVTRAVVGLALTLAIGAITGLVTYAATGQALTAARGSVSSEIDYAASGQDLRLYSGIALGPNDRAVDVSSQEVAAAIGGTLAFPSASVTGQLVTAAIGAATHPPDVNRVVSGLSCSAATGAVSSDVSAFPTGQNLNAEQGVATRSGDVTVAVTGMEMVAAIECYKSTVADTGPNEKTYTIFDSGGSHDIAPNLYPAYDAFDLSFPLPMGMMASASDHAVLNTESLGTCYKYYANGRPAGLPPGPAQFQTVGFTGNPDLGVPYDYTLDFDGLGDGNHAGVLKDIRPGGFVPDGIFTWDGHLIGTNHGPFSAALGPGYANFSKLVYDNQGGNLVCHQLAFGFYETTQMYCAYIQIVVTTNKQAAVLLQADTFDGALNVLWVSGGPPGKLKHAVHLSPSLHIGDSTNGWETTQVVETDDSTSSCGIVYLPEGRLYVNYEYAGQHRQRYNDQRGTGDVTGWSARAEANANRISAGGRGQEQAWRFLAGSSSQADIIYFSQCRDGQGLGWTDQTMTTKAVDGTARGPLCGGVWTGNQQGLLYTRHSDGKVFYLTTSNPDSWSGTGTDTTFTGNTCGLARHPSGRLVGLLQASAGGACKVIYSSDQGATWTDVSLSITPTPPPVITCDQGGGVLYIVYIESDQQKYIASLDSGATWT